MTSPPVPDTFQGTPVPDTIRAQWDTWEGARWRTMRYGDRGNLFPPDQRFSVRPPAGMCPLHLRHRQQYRDMHFNPRTGNRWPGNAGSPFTIIDRNLGRELEWRRREWDDKASEQMRLIEGICLSGRSPQCDRPEPTGTPESTPVASEPHVSAWTLATV